MRNAPLLQLTWHTNAIVVDHCCWASALVIHALGASRALAIHHTRLIRPNNRNTLALVLDFVAAAACKKWH